MEPNREVKSGEQEEQEHRSPRKTDSKWQKLYQQKFEDIVSRNRLREQQALQSGGKGTDSTDDGCGPIMETVESPKAKTANETSEPSKLVRRVCMAEWDDADEVDERSKARLQRIEEYKIRLAEYGRQRFIKRDPLECSPTGIFFL